MLIEKHKHCSNNKQEIEKSSTCGCFCCGEIFDSKDIKNWVKGNEQTAICSYCYVNAILGDASGINISNNLLVKMHNKWF